MPIKNSEQNISKGVSLSILAVLLGSTVTAVAKHLVGQVDISAIIFIQYLICLACTLPWLLKNGLKALHTQHPWQHTIRGVSGCIGFYALYIALTHVSLVDATLLRNTAPLIVPVVIFFWLGIRIPRARWLPLILGFIGVAIILKPGTGALSVWHLVGLCSGAGLAISMVSTRLLVNTEPSSRVLFYYFFISLLFATPFFVLNYRPTALTAIPWLLYIGVLMYFAFMLYTTAFKYAKPSVLAPTSYFAVIFSGVLDWLFWEHLPDIWTMAGSLLVIAGGVLILRQGIEKSPS